jgi:hypothetical protein
MEVPIGTARRQTISVMSISPSVVIFFVVLGARQLAKASNERKANPVLAIAFPLSPP